MFFLIWVLDGSKVPHEFFKGPDLVAALLHFHLTLKMVFDGSDEGLLWL